MIINEVKVMRILNGTHNMIKLYQIFEDEEKIYLVMEFFDGIRLLNYITQNKHLTETEASEILLKLLFALIELKRHHITHRDIKSENIMIRKNANSFDVKLIDFGLATFNIKNDIIQICGTPGYIAPEILKEIEYDDRVDIFSLGAVLYLT